ncbi:MAG: hypothetical protein EOP83_06905 [Verrucomicrobiaceae bacterium]|nr:MAG: hypothetical protein EOP83_06905 [Verrucomicrobiaceae bacterium]
MFVGEFDNERDVCKEFRIDKIGGFVIFAGYEIDGYEGAANVIFVQGGKFWHVEGSHCSCYGLEDQWEPEEMPVEALLHIAEKGYGPLRQYAVVIRERIQTVLDTLGLDGDDPERTQFALKLALG